MKKRSQIITNQKKFALWHLEEGSHVFFKDKPHKILHILSMQTFLVEDMQTKKSEVAFLKDLSPVKKDPGDSSLSKDDENVIDINSVDGKKWAEARRRHHYIKQMLEPDCNRTKVEEISKEAKLSVATLYRLRNEYLTIGKVSALIPGEHSGGRGKTRLDPKVEEIIEAGIEELYLVPERVSIKETALDIQRRCSRAGLPAPSENTVKNRIDLIDDQRKIAIREGKNAARRKEPTRGKFPEPLGPLEVVQIDHTQVDLIVVDSVTRMAYTRPFITVLIDVWSRMVLGFYVTFDEPSILSVGLCLVHGMLPKDDWLREREINFAWDAWGLVKKIYADNAGEFRGEDLRRACEEYEIDLEWRPVGKPHYGAHIESLLDTFNQDIHTIPGTTFSNVVERSEYDSEGQAVLSLEEFEKWLAIFVVGKYHQRVHSQLRISPIAKFEQGIFGSEDKPGIGIPEIILDKEKLLFDFLPTFERSIQDYGVSIDEIRYDDSVLSQFRGARDLKNRKLARQFVFKRDPRNINKIYFYHPEIKRYFPIPYKNLSNPAMSLWELRAVRQRLKEQNINRIDNEEIIFRALEEMRGIISTGKEITKKMRREFERNRRLAKSQGAMPGPEPPYIPSDSLKEKPFHQSSNAKAGEKTTLSSKQTDQWNKTPDNIDFAVYKIKKNKRPS
jgi:putative transposase